jgi:hypothetical protein
MRVRHIMMATHSAPPRNTLHLFCMIPLVCYQHSGKLAHLGSSLWRYPLSAVLRYVYRTVIRFMSHVWHIGLSYAGPIHGGSGLEWQWPCAYVSIGASRCTVARWAGPVGDIS